MADRDRRLARWRMRYPTIAELEQRARQRIPYFAFEYLHDGTGDLSNRPHNIAALRAVEVVPRYCGDVEAASTAVRLFGRRYQAPVAIAPVGMDGAIWPGATRLLAETARDAGLPYMTGTMATTSMEEVSRMAPESFWFQLYTMPAQDHRVSFDLIRRAEAAGALVLAVTVDVPAPGRRVRDMRNGFSVPRRITPRMMAGALTRPAWLAALARAGMPHFENMAPYGRPGARKSEYDLFVKGARSGSGVTWDTLARFRERWPRALVVKGIMHPGDAEKALALGCDGVVVSNHGGRQFDPAPTSIDVLPAIRAAVGDRMSVLMDGGILSGFDVLKALACGADAVLVGRAFMLGLAALGADGARHVALTLMEELKIALVQTGARDLAGAARLAVRHRGAWRLEDFEAAAERSPADRPQYRDQTPRLSVRIEASNGGGEGSDPVSSKGSDPASTKELNG
jgi:(S)-mandelate dehydrogenase